MLAVFLAVSLCSGLEAAPIEVRFAEGTAHGLLLVRTVKGEIVGHGDFLQTVEAHHVQSQLILRFKDGSLHHETVTFSQPRLFTMLSYRLVQRGPSFPETMDASLDRTAGTYKVRSGRDGKEEAESGKIELPPDVYNGLVPMLLKNVASGRSETIHIVAFTPKPRLIQLEMVPSGKLALMSSDHSRPGTRYALKPKLGAALRFFATLLGKAPADQECVILTQDVPAFVRCDGPLYLKGPVWRVETTSAQ